MKLRNKLKLNNLILCKTKQFLILNESVKLKDMTLVFINKFYEYINKYLYRRLRECHNKIR